MLHIETQDGRITRITVTQNQDPETGLPVPDPIPEGQAVATVTVAVREVPEGQADAVRAQLVADGLCTQLEAFGLPAGS